METLASSVLAGRVVERSKLWSAGSGMPDPPSVAVQWIVTSFACHSPSELPQETSGAFRSIMLGPMGPAWVWFPTRS